MRLSKSLFLLYSLLIFSTNVKSQELKIPAELFSRAEKTNYRETSLNADVVKFCRTIGDLSKYAHVESIGTTKDGNELMIVILANPKVTSPAEAAAAGKNVIYIQGNIHAGEVEGKEASMQLIREICFGPKTGLIENQVLIFCPNYNPDGNDKLSSTSRPSQDGSPLMTGVRTSGEGYDLNREGIKVEAIESKALVKNIITKWDPLLSIDLHTDNGSWHGYTLNYAPDFHTTGMPATTDYVSHNILPYAESSVLERSGIPVFFHGYMSIREGEQTTYSTYSHLPRYIVNYIGLRNRMAILSETFSHDGFEKRVLSNYLFLIAVLEYTAGHGAEMAELVKNADNETIRIIEEQAGKLKKGVTYEIAAAPEPIDLLTRETAEFRDENNRVRRKPTGRLLWINNVKHFDHFEPVTMATVPIGYIFPASLKNVADKLSEHGISVTVLRQRARAEGEQFIISRYTRENRETYGGHRTARAEGSFINKNITFQPGSYYVDMRQPLAWLIFYMLEPQSDDGLLFWNYFDDYLLPSGVETRPVAYPVLKLMKPL